MVTRGDSYENTVGHTHTNGCSYVNVDARCFNSFLAILRLANRTKFTQANHNASLLPAYIAFGNMTPIYLGACYFAIFQTYSKYMNS